MLTHHNLVANIRQVTQVFMLGGDKVLGILPLFHSFGFTVGLWLPAVHGIGVVFHPNSLDATSISELVSKYNVTFLIATPTFLASVYAAPPARTFWRPAICAGWRGKAARADGAGFRRHLWNTPA
jgi:acyl-CoA synthetase (AMP-forming)/AMP-acid ligase II